MDNIGNCETRILVKLSTFPIIEPTSGMVHKHHTGVEILEQVAGPIDGFLGLKCTITLIGVKSDKDTITYSTDNKNWFDKVFEVTNVADSKKGIYEGQRLQKDM